MPTLTSPIRFLLLLALAAAGGLLAVGASPAKAEDAYRYWTYWWGADGSWEYAASGPGERVLSQGTVEGWLYQTSGEAVPETVPGAEPSFEELCGGSAPAGDGQIQVAVVIDYGTAADAPTAEDLPDGPDTACVTVPVGSTGNDALAAAGDVRSEEGAVCGLNGYPTSGCFEVVSLPDGSEAGEQAPESDAANDDGPDAASGPQLWLSLLGILAVAVIVALLIVRNRNASRQ